MTLLDVPWSSGRWLNPPAAVVQDGHHLLATSRANGDFWRTTSYGFVHDDGHALLVDLPDGAAIEVELVVDLEAAFDQAGLMVRAADTDWVKAGVELSDGVVQLGAVVTRGVSDWSTSPVPDWAGRTLTVRASRSGDALTVRARTDGPWRLVRLAPLDPDLRWRAGPYMCSPSGAGLVVRFTRFALGPADPALHVD